MLAWIRMLKEPRSFPATIPKSFYMIMKPGKRTTDKLKISLKSLQFCWNPDLGPTFAKWNPYFMFLIFYLFVLMRRIMDFVNKGLFIILYGKK